MTANFKTCDHIAAIYAHAARTVRNGSTLKSTREYMLYQLVTRVEAGEVEGADVGHCSGAYSLQGVLRSKADFLAHCDREAAYWSDLASAHIQAQREAKKAREATPRTFLEGASVTAVRAPGRKNWYFVTGVRREAPLAPVTPIAPGHPGTRFTAIVNAANGEGIAEDYAIACVLTRNASYATVAQGEWDEMYYPGSWEDRGAELIDILPGWQQVSKPQAPEELIDLARDVLEGVKINVDLTDCLTIDPTMEDAEAGILTAALAVKAWANGEIPRDLADTVEGAIQSRVMNAQDYDQTPENADEDPLSALADACLSYREKWEENAEIMERQTHNALNYLANAENCLMQCAHSFYPHARKAIDLINDTVGVLSDFQVK